MPLYWRLLRIRGSPELGEIAICNERGAALGGKVDYWGVSAIRKFCIPAALERVYARELSHGQNVPLVILDTDVVVADDVALMWHAAGARVGSVPPVYGLALEQGDWGANMVHDVARCIQSPEHRGEALNVSINSGIVSVDLLQYHRQNVSSTLQALMDECPEALWGGSDQGAYNALFARHQTLLHVLDCGWNVQSFVPNQRGTNDHLKRFCQRTHKRRVFHFNGPPHAKHVNHGDFELAMHRAWEKAQPKVLLGFAHAASGHT